MTRERPTHIPMTQFPAVDGVLQVGGVPLTTLATRVGGTPFYAYDRQLISNRIAELRAQLPGAIELHYAMKANPMPAVVHHLAGLVDGIDVASAGELQVALDTGTPPSEISFAGPGKRDGELAQALTAGITINLESFGEMERLARLGEQHGHRPRVAVRVNPDFELKASGMKMGGGPKVFGVDAELVPDMLGRIRELDLAFQGFHIFTGSQNLRAESLFEAHDKTFDLAYRLAEEAREPLTFLNIGGGLGIPYFPGDQPIDLAAVGEHLHDHVETAHRRLGKAKLVMELGRYMVGEAGVYVTRVIDRKVSRGHTYLITDGGLHHHLAASGNFGQVIRKNYPVAIGNRMDVPPQENATVTGPLCTPLDMLADRMDLPRANVGDLVVVFQSGAYGLTASPLGFLSHPGPGEVLV
ncbi:pyridoxal-dependent decarboxylase, exosortase A system-associated [Aquisalimonas sp.]|uniref:pyridoxal-dependent decarboxylase, exosortase A system-associated n=1 Tax=Aquisalimonas sp. TaxID=1872621 RepID=UPI0025C0F997|nr:pyridoxal-dependent decarboxylase, exosortase A system-associated [Aquisalimonas sp.]